MRFGRSLCAYVFGIVLISFSIKSDYLIEINVKNVVCSRRHNDIRCRRICTVIAIWFQVASLLAKARGSSLFHISFPKYYNISSPKCFKLPKCCNFQMWFAMNRNRWQNCTKSSPKITIYSIGKWDLKIRMKIRQQSGENPPAKWRKSNQMSMISEFTCAPCVCVSIKQLMTFEVYLLKLSGWKCGASAHFSR